MRNSLKIIRSQDIFVAVVAKAQYSTSVEERATVVYFLDDQEMGEGLRNSRRPVVERRSWGLPTQSASEKAVRVKGPGEKEMP